MSRHRLIRNLDLDDEMDDAALDDESGAFDMTPEQAAQMRTSYAQVESILGTESSFTEQEIKDALWFYYFDAEKAVAYLLEEQHKQAAKREAAAAKAKAKENNSAKSTPASTPRHSQAGKPRTATGATPSKKQPVPGTATTAPVTAVSKLQADMEGMGLSQDEDSEGTSTPPAPVAAVAREDVLKELVRRETEEKPLLSLVVVGHVDAGKSTLMGRLLHELGATTDRALTNNQRQSEKMGKGSFAYAWTFDALPEERARGVTIDVAVDSFSTPHRQFTLIDAPGHRDFVPNMISGASQADSAVLVVDASKGAFEAGFNEGGQTREHAMLVRALGVQQLVVVVNKLDAVGWSQSRFEYICEQLQPFLQQSGFAADRLAFVPCAAYQGENLLGSSAPALTAWYEGPTLVDQLDNLIVPQRAYHAPLRIPISNVFKGGSGATGTGLSGRVESGIVQVGERLAVLPGDESGVVRSLEVDEERVAWAAAGQSVTIYLTGIDAIYLSVGCVLCPLSSPIPLAHTFEAQLMVFDIAQPILAGTAVELFHHGADTPATVSSLLATLDRSTGAVIKSNPRMLQRNGSARVKIQIRGNANSAGSRNSVVALETFTANKAMGRVLLRRNGETIAAGIVLAVLS